MKKKEEEELKKKREETTWASARARRALKKKEDGAGLESASEVSRAGGGKTDEGREGRDPEYHILSHPLVLR